MKGEIKKNNLNLGERIRNDYAINFECIIYVLI